jgi:hypothetical protein
MTQEFKTAIAPYFFEGNTFCPTFISKINGWPDVSEVNEYKNFPQSKVLDCEKILFIESTADTLKVICGGEWQSDYLVTIVFVEGNLVIESCEEWTEPQPNEDDLISHEDFENSFAGIVIGRRKNQQKSAWAYKMELERAIKREDYKRASEIRDEMVENNIRL